MTDGNQTGEEVVVLREIWNELKAVHGSLKGELAKTREELNSRIDATNARLDGVRDELKLETSVLRRSVVESELRVATAVTELAGTIGGLRDVVMDWRTEDRTERQELRRRLERLETRPPDGEPR